MDPQLARLRRRTADKVAELAELRIGPALISALHQLRGEPMTAATAVEVHALWEKAIAWATAQQMIATSEAVTGIRGRVELSPSNAAMLTAQELACATHIAYATAMNNVALVEKVAARMPASWEALDRGDLTLAHLKSVERATRSCTPRVTEAVDARIIPRSIERGWTPSETARAAQRLVIAIDPAGAQDRAAAAKDCSDVEFYPLPDGVANLSVTGDAVRSREMYDKVNDLAEAMGRAGDDRPVGVRRVSALYDLVMGCSGHDQPVPTQRRSRSRRTTTLVRIDLPTLLGLNDHPGELDGYGPITAEVARRIAADSTLRRLVTDPLTGDGFDLGRTSYQPSAGLRAAVEATRPTCGMPGCSRPSIDCEVDHRREFDRRTDPGHTDLCNLGPLCKMHHQLKTKKLWKVDVLPDGNEAWTSLLGFTYIKKSNVFPLPDPLPIDDEVPQEIADRLPQTFDPDPPYPDEPLPAPPRLTDEQYEEMEHAVDSLEAFGMTFRQWCDRYYDEARATGLVA